MADSVVRGWIEAWRQLGRLVVPLACAGCGKPETRWCEGCQAAWRRGTRRVEQWAPRLDTGQGVIAPVWAAAVFHGTPRAVVVAWKDGRRRDLDAEMCQVIRAVAADAKRDAVGARGVVVVPVPSSPASVQRRGVDLTQMLARHVATVWRAQVRQVVAVRRGRADQAGLGVRARSSNARQSFRARGGMREIRGSRVLVVDDVQTTGATLAAVLRMLAECGAVPIGAVCLAATPPPGYAEMTASEGARGQPNRR